MIMDKQKSGKVKLRDIEYKGIPMTEELFDKLLLPIIDKDTQIDLKIENNSLIIEGLDLEDKEWNTSYLAFINAIIVKCFGLHYRLMAMSFNGYWELKLVELIPESIITVTDEESVKEGE